jgi:predicted RecA/RadA family phage recombinase
VRSGWSSFAVIAAGDRYGATSATTLVTQPLMVEPSVPSILSPGDVTEVAVRLTNTTPGPLAVRLDVAAPDLVSVQGDEAEVAMAPGVSMVVTRRLTARSSGEGVLVGLIFGVAITDAASGADVAVQTTGVWSLAKVSAQAWSVGVAIYWDDGNTRCTTSDTGVPIGVAVAAAANPSATGLVRLNGFVVADIYSA